MSPGTAESPANFHAMSLAMPPGTQSLNTRARSTKPARQNSALFLYFGARNQARLARKQFSQVQYSQQNLHKPISARTKRFTFATLVATCNGKKPFICFLNPNSAAVVLPGLLLTRFLLGLPNSSCALREHRPLPCFALPPELGSRSAQRHRTERGPLCRHFATTANRSTLETTTSHGPLERPKLDNQEAGSLLTSHLRSSQPA